MASAWLDFDMIRLQADFETVLRHYGLTAIGAGQQRFVLCPFHSEKTPSCSINFKEKLFHCFGCGAAGTIIDFVALLDRVDLREAAKKVAKLCVRSPLENLTTRVYGRPQQYPANTASDASKNRPLNYQLQLDPTHPYLRQRGLSAETIRIFGLGYCQNGPMRGRICIPIHDREGCLVAYAGRWAADPVPPGVPRYLLSRGFRKRQVLFNLHRLSNTYIVLVEGFWSVFRLEALGVPAAGLMGTSVSSEQIQLLATAGIKSVSLLMDGDEAGYRGRLRIAAALFTNFWVRSPKLQLGNMPDELPAAHLLTHVQRVAIDDFGGN